MENSKSPPPHSARWDPALRNYSMIFFNLWSFFWTNTILPWPVHIQGWSGKCTRTWCLVQCFCLRQWIDFPGEFPGKSLQIPTEHKTIAWWATIAVQKYSIIPRDVLFTRPGQNPACGHVHNFFDDLMPRRARCDHCSIKRPTRWLAESRYEHARKL